MAWSGTKALSSLVVVPLLITLFAGLALANIQINRRESPVSIVALGDSYISGNGAGGYEESDPDCWRSANSFPYRYGEFLAESGRQVSVTHVGCSGSLTSDIPSQIASAQEIETDPSIVLVNVGANDLNYAGRTGLCVAPSGDGSCPLAGAGGEADSLEQRIRTTLLAVADGFPTADRILLTGYPDLDSPRCGPSFDEMFAAFDQLGRIQSRVVDELARSVDGAGPTLNFVPLAKLYEARGPCRVWSSIEGENPQRWVLNMEGLPAEQGHPSAFGHEMTAQHLIELGFYADPPAPGTLLIESTADTQSPQELRGAVLDTENVVVLQGFAVDYGGDVNLWWNGGSWIEAVSSFPIPIEHGRWAFEWDPDQTGTGAYVVSVIPFDHRGQQMTDGVVLNIDTEAGVPPLPEASVVAESGALIVSGTVEIAPKLSGVRGVVRHPESGEYWDGSTWGPEAAVLTMELVDLDATRRSFTYTLPIRLGQIDLRLWAVSPTGQNSDLVDVIYVP